LGAEGCRERREPESEKARAAFPPLAPPSGKMFTGRSGSQGDQEIRREVHGRVTTRKELRDLLDLPVMYLPDSQPSL
jgi:hypothetical protein